MDKYDLVLDIIEHPEKYSGEKLQEIMADEEVKEIYTLLCKTDSAVEANKTFNAESGWESFKSEHLGQPHHRSWWLGSRAASIASIIGTSVVAVAAGVALTVALSEPHTATDAQLSEVAVVDNNIAISDTIAQAADSLVVAKEPILFEDASLEDILKEVGGVYNANVVFKDKEVSTLHLYYKFDPTLPLDEIVTQLNTFEQINISFSDKTLTIN